MMVSGHHIRRRVVAKLPVRLIGLSLAVGGRRSRRGGMTDAQAMDQARLTEYLSGGKWNTKALLLSQ